MTERQEGEVWTVDADTTLQSLLDSPECPELLRRALTGIYSWQLRNETTVRRALGASQLMPQWLAALLALGSVVTVEGGDSPERHPKPVEGPVAGQAPLRDLLEHKVQGHVIALHIPTEGSHTRWGTADVGRAAADEPIVAAFAVVKMNAGAVEEARVVLTGAWPEPVRLAETPGVLVGEPLSEDRIRAVAAAVEEEVDPQGDYLGSAAYRRAMAGVLTRRALEACAAALTAGGGR
jgi:CO/xanthine dehydrogenase FAD-binding subunit